MRVNGRHVRTIWRASSGHVAVLDQRALPHRLSVVEVATSSEMAEAIRDMTVRGAGLIGASAAWGMALAAREQEGSSDFEAAMAGAGRHLMATRPTARNLEWAVERMRRALADVPRKDRVARAEACAQEITDEDASCCRRAGQYGLEWIRAVAKRKPGQVIHVLTHCNAGWLAFVDYGSALAPVYAAAEEGLPVHVWVDETRPRNQGASLTAWELGQQGIPHTLIPDNAGGHLMQHGLVDLVITGADRVTAHGDVANKIGTYLKALAARDNKIPFVVVFPSSTLDWSLTDGVKEIPIEERGGDEVRQVTGWDDARGTLASVRICPVETPAANYGFDVTPARLVSGLVTERGLAEANRSSLEALFAEEEISAAEGYIQFHCDHRPGPPLAHPQMAALLQARETLQQAGVLGVLPSGIGFGNVSVRTEASASASCPSGRFLITASATGGIRPGTPDVMCEVDEADVATNSVRCHGPRPASSETLTHAAVYAARPDAGAVIHIHDRVLFHRLLGGGAPMTPPHARFGTVAMAEATGAVAAHGAAAGCLAMTGHEDGVLAWAPDVAGAMAALERARIPFSM